MLAFLPWVPLLQQSLPALPLYLACGRPRPVSARDELGLEDERACFPLSCSSPRGVLTMVHSVPGLVGCPVS